MIIIFLLPNQTEHMLHKPSLHLANAALGVHWVTLGTISEDLIEPWQSRTKGGSKLTSGKPGKGGMVLK